MVDLRKFNAWVGYNLKVLRKFANDDIESIAFNDGNKTIKVLCKCS